MPSGESSANNELPIASTNIVSANEQNLDQTNSNKLADLPVAQVTNWQIEIEKLNLTTNIAEGTSSEVMNVYVGHFSVTSKWNGNVALAAHNRGYPVNYFANLKKLEKGEIIEYHINGKTRKYRIETITKIRDTDWRYLENTEDNRITLITCVENEPDYRRCIQAVEI